MGSTGTDKSRFRFVGCLKVWSCLLPSCSFGCVTKNSSVVNLIYFKQKQLFVSFDIKSIHPHGLSNKLSSKSMFLGWKSLRQSIECYNVILLSEDNEKVSHKVLEWRNEYKWSDPRCHHRKTFWLRNKRSGQIGCSVFLHHIFSG